MPYVVRTWPFMVHPFPGLPDRAIAPATSILPPGGRGPRSFVTTQTGRVDAGAYAVGPGSVPGPTARVTLSPRP
ncbi:hypothetical protein GCM10009868_12090 [Terrabacter aerolatus]|uniref:Uncharacterized protein n=1 Tax=Terrabacter aerolatus TaxID=422442 RepID=A0A512CXW4_9MICO|nr:hypothetical protein TAE01_08750 [Terrabacter aerolatus]